MKNANEKDVIVCSNGVKIEVEHRSTVIKVPADGEKNTTIPLPLTIKSAHYPSVVRLNHNGENNGKLIASFSLGYDCDDPSIPFTNACFMESDDDGKTWHYLSRAEEIFEPDLKPGSMAHIYELPAKVGNMPAGTLLYAANSVDYSRRSILSIWRSFDCGKTWHQYTLVAEGGGLKEGIWEPFLWYEPSDGYLYCFYSDDSGPVKDQTLVYKRSKDGENWEDLVDVVVADDPAERIGMLILTKMGNGEYFIVYENVHNPVINGKPQRHAPIYYKTTKDVSDWDPYTPGTLLESDGYIKGSAPGCVWTPAGGECGTLIVGAKYEVVGDGSQRLFVSFDYGKTWETVRNPLPYDLKYDYPRRNGYSPAFIVGSDESVIYYLNTVEHPDDKKQMIAFAKLRITKD